MSLPVSNGEKSSHPGRRGGCVPQNSCKTFKVMLPKQRELWGDLGTAVGFTGSPPPTPFLRAAPKNPY